MSLPGQYYAKNTTDITLIPDVRAALLYPFDAGLWTQIRIGLAISPTSDADPNASPVAESRTASTFSDWIAIGLKNSDNEDLPGQSANARFAGMLNASTTSVMQLVGGRYSMPLSMGTTIGLTVDKRGVAGTIGDSGTLWSVANLTGNATYCAVLQLQFTVANRGLINQQITMGWNYGVHAVTVGAIRAQLAGFTAINGQFETYNFAGTLPDALFIRWPFLQNRCRIHAVVVEKFS